MPRISILMDACPLPNAEDTSPGIVEDDMQSLIVLLQALEDHRFRLREITNTCTPVLMTVGCADA
jgi:hypothetical protein